MYKLRCVQYQNQKYIKLYKHGETVPITHKGSFYGVVTNKKWGTKY